MQNLLLLSLLLLTGSLLFGVMQWRNAKASSSELQEEKQQHLALQKDCDELREQFQGSEKHMALLKDPNTILVGMGGQPGFENETVNIFWNKNTREYFLGYEGTSLPAPRAGHEYVLWGFVGAAPQSMEPFDFNTMASLAVRRTNLTGQIHTFAISLEKQDADLSGGPQGAVHVVGAI